MDHTRWHRIGATRLWRHRRNAVNTAPITKPAMRAGYSSAKKPVMTKGRRDFFTYRDLGVKDASNGKCAKAGAGT